MNDRFLGGQWRSFRRDRLGQILNADSFGINAPKVVEFIRALLPDLVVVFGTSILGRDLMNQVPGFYLNMHTGLVPFYRGTHSAEWAILNGDAAGIGATIHHLRAGVDCGPIVIQGRPRLSQDDTPASINLKLYALATELMVRAIRFYASTGTLPGVEQDLSLGKCYRRRDFSQSVQRELAGLFADGRFGAMIRNVQEHLEDSALVDCTIHQKRHQSCHCDA